ncbi:hypothetical protein GNQ08_10145 [Paenibacillus macerans]|uniref:Uncharacterized protein n=2 Tax=Paenibacillus macerans TaxID=44252 RepID=A0A6N8EWF1_PAEMA|nr:hypothetical protein [Paenibacillus macerans]MUG22771.1 hypothetical protein [Paenibacillus macerans]
MKMRKMNDDEAYTALFIEFSGKVEKALKKAVIALLAALCLFQGLLRIPELRPFLASADQFEGAPLYKDEFKKPGF